MNLEGVRRVKAAFDALAPEDQAPVEAAADHCARSLAEEFPALPDSDRAAIACYMIGTLNGVSDLPVSDAGTALTNLAAGFGLTAVDLLGWRNV